MKIKNIVNIITQQLDIFYTLVWHKAIEMGYLLQWNWYSRWAQYDRHAALYNNILMI